MIVFPPCKINLGLNIIGKRKDGFHDLETLFYPVPLCDMLELVEGNVFNQNKCGIQMEGLPVAGSEENNLVLKAYHLLDAHYQLPVSSFCLYKHIPMGAGLGGGSADGAYAIRLLNAFYELNIPIEKQLDFAAQLGSDCAFFIQDMPCIGKGRGELLHPFDLSLAGYWIVLVKPKLHISTAEAFAGIQINPLQTGQIESLLKEPIESWRGRLENDFEASLFPKHPILEQIKNSLYASGASYAAMSGSGSTLFALFRFEPNLKDHFTEHFYWQGKL